MVGELVMNFLKINYRSYEFIKELAEYADASPKYSKFITEKRLESIADIGGYMSLIQFSGFSDFERLKQKKKVKTVLREIFQHSKN